MCPINALDKLYEVLWVLQAGKRYRLNCHAFTYAYSDEYSLW